jgi:hypothetical protein
MIGQPPTQLPYKAQNEDWMKTELLQSALSFPRHLATIRIGRGPIGTI